MNAAEFHSARKFADTPYGRIAYIERGRGPAALFLHGLPLCGFQWRAVVEDLEPIRTCLAPDLMGLGYSEIPARQDLSFDSQAAMIVAFLDALGVAQVDVIGNDTGAGVSQIFAAKNPARVRTLTLTNCEVSDLWPNQMLTQFYDGLKAGLVGEGLKVMATDEALARTQFASVYEDPKMITAESLGVYFGPFADSADRREQVRGFAGWERNRAQLVAAGSRLRDLKAPAQIIWGDADTAFDAAASLKWLHANLPGLKRTAMVPRAKLFWPEEHPRVLSTLLSEFWK